MNKLVETTAENIRTTHMNRESAWWVFLPEKEKQSERQRKRKDENLSKYSPGKGRKVFFFTPLGC